MHYLLWKVVQITTHGKRKRKTNMMLLCTFPCSKNRSSCKYETVTIISIRYPTSSDANKYIASVIHAAYKSIKESLRDLLKAIFN